MNKNIFKKMCERDFNIRKIVNRINFNLFFFYFVLLVKILGSYLQLHALILVQAVNFSVL